MYRHIRPCNTCWCPASKNMCRYRYTYIYTYIYICICIHACMYVYININTYVCLWHISCLDQPGPRWPFETPDSSCLLKATVEWILTPGLLPQALYRGASTRAAANTLDSRSRTTIWVGIMILYRGFILAPTRVLNIYICIHIFVESTVLRPVYHRVARRLELRVNAWP